MENIKFFKQETDYTCGPACIRMILVSLGIKKSEKEISKLLKTNKRRGTWHKDFPILAEKFKLNYVSMRNASINDLKEYQKRGYIIIVCYYYDSWKIDHYALLKKIDKKYIYLFDPFFGENHKFALIQFNKIWKSDKRYDNEKRWFFAVKNK